MAKGKGSGYERELAKQLSLWWSKGERDDIYWRTAGSGAMAQTRRRFGRKAFGQHGDIQATDPIGQPLIHLFSIEAKRGHKEAHIGDVLDRLRNRQVRLWESFVHQARRDCRNGDSHYWMLIIRRDRRAAMVYFPWNAYKLLKMVGCKLQKASPWIKFKPTANKGTEKRIGFVFGTTLQEFLKHVSREKIEQCLEHRDFFI